MTTRDFAAELRTYVAAELSARGWSERELARRAGVKPTTLNKALAKGDLQLSTVVGIAQGLGVPAFTLLMNAEERARWASTERPMGAVPGANAEDRLRALEESQKRVEALLNRVAEREAQEAGLHDYDHLTAEQAMERANLLSAEHDIARAKEAARVAREKKKRSG